MCFAFAPGSPGTWANGQEYEWEESMWLIDWLISWLIDRYHHPFPSLNRWLQFHVSIDWNDWVLRRGPSREKLCLFCARLSPHPFLFLSCWRLELFFLSFSFCFLSFHVVYQLHPDPVLFFHVCFHLFGFLFLFLFFFLLSSFVDQLHFIRMMCLRRVSCESFAFRARLSFFFCLPCFSLSLLDWACGF